MAFFQLIKKGLLFISFALCVIGYFLITKGQDSIEIGVDILSYVLMFAGAFEVIRYFTSKVDDRFKKNGFVVGLFVLIGGIVLLIFKEEVVNASKWLIGIIMIISAIYKIQDSMDCKRIKKSHFGVYITLVIICIAFGALIILSPFNTNTLFVVMGVGLIFAGSSDFISNIYLAIIGAIKNKKIKKEEPKITQEEKQEDESDDSHMTRIDL